MRQGLSASVVSLCMLLHSGSSKQLCVWPALALGAFAYMAHVTGVEPCQPYCKRRILVNRTVSGELHRCAMCQPDILTGFGWMLELTFTRCSRSGCRYCMQTQWGAVTWHLQDGMLPGGHAILVGRQSVLKERPGPLQWFQQLSASTHEGFHAIMLMGHPILHLRQGPEITRDPAHGAMLEGQSRHAT